MALEQHFFVTRRDCIILPRIPFWLCDSSVEPWDACRGLLSTSILIFFSRMCCPGSACTLLLTCIAAFLFNALLSYGDKLLLLDDGSGRCSEFVGAAIDLVAELAALVKTVRVLRRRRCSLKIYHSSFPRHVTIAEMRSFQNHSHGLVWNPRGDDMVVEELSSVAEGGAQADS